jgi:hypothetical protein
MKRKYVKPVIELYSYAPEEGFAHSVAQYKDYVLIEGDDRSSMRAAEEVTEFTDHDGEYMTGEWMD